MTREEAIEIIRKNLPSDKSLPVYEALHTLIPELAESERIRKELVAFFKEMRDTWHEIYWHDLQVEGILAWLEKQKENPKSADSIPSDCVSDAKCEDRWHKVEDSLPNNGRMVLANDCLGNTLLARYDGEGNWEVSVYDNEDYYCRNTITKWCEIPSEKQKEPHYTKRNALFDKCVENCDPKVMKSVSDEVDEMLQKEQWSEEDEKNLNEIIHFFESLCSCLATEERHAENRKWLKFLKSLRPQPKAELTLLDKNIIEAAVAFVEQNNHFNCWGGIDKHTVIKALRSLKPHWKPSEEQMKALCNAIAITGICSSLDAVNTSLELESLREQLKKLM